MDQSLEFAGLAGFAAARYGAAPHLLTVDGSNFQQRQMERIAREGEMEEKRQDQKSEERKVDMRDLGAEQGEKVRGDPILRGGRGTKNATSGFPHQGAIQASFEHHDISGL